MARPKRDDVTPLTVTVLNEQGQPTTEIKVNGWTSANAVTAKYADNGKQTQVTPRTN
jgi:hypothetical protein